MRVLLVEDLRSARVLITCAEFAHLSNLNINNTKFIKIRVL